MDQIKIKIDELTDEFNNNSHLRKLLFLECQALNKRMRDYEDKNKELSKQINKLKDIIDSKDIFASVTDLDGFDILSEEERALIVKGMDKTDYTTHDQHVERWIDLKRLIKEVVEFKIQYPGWILESVNKNGQYDTLPPKNFYKFTYKTPLGHYFTCGGIEIIQY